MNTALDAALPTTAIAIAGHTFALRDRAGGMLSLHVDLRGAPLVALARALAQLDGVRVSGGPAAGPDGERCYLVHCSGFKMVLSSPVSDRAGKTSGQISDFALALVSRAPQAALAVVSDLGSLFGSLFDRLMTEPPPAVALEPAPASRAGSRQPRRSALRPGKPLTRKTALKRKTPLARGRFGRA